MEHALQQLLAVRPFVPFQIRMSDSERYSIFEADLARIEMDGTLVVFRRKPGTVNGRERRAVVAMHHIVSLVEGDEVSDIPF